MARVYGLQFKKLLKYIETVYIPKVPKEAAPARFRLETLLKDFKTGGALIVEHVEDEPENFVKGRKILSDLCNARFFSS